jgi:CheY-like chemotaxis protein
LNNAAKYTPSQGHIRLKAWQEGATAVVEVADDGMGIPAEMLEQVFTLFMQVGRTLDRAQGGLGIGLYLVRSLVELHGGAVSAASEGPGRGSVFTVRMPCLLPATAANTGGPHEAAAGHASEEGLKVLVVDDNVDAAESLATVLQMTGRKTFTVYDGPSVLQAARDFAPDIVLLDIGLPGMSGYDVARQLRADSGLSRSVLIAVTGWGSEEDRRRSREAGFDEHLTKPIDIAMLEPLLRRFTAGPPSRRVA